MSLSVLQPPSASQAVTQSAMKPTPANRPERPEPNAAAPSAASLFGSRLDHARTAGKSDKDQLRELTEMLVSTAFISPMFEQMRSDPLAANLFHGGRGEEVFQQQFDQVYADRIASASRMGLADALYNQLSQDPAAGQSLNTHG